MNSNLLIARAEDTADAAYKNGRPKFLGFLSETESAMLKKHFSFRSDIAFFGGFNEAERCYMGVFPDWCESGDFPVCAVTFSYRSCDALTHRDFLGALMSLGIARECVGDILVEPSRAVVFLSREIAPFVKLNVDKVGAVGVKLSEGFISPLPQFGKKEEFSSSVSSLRIDNVVAALCGVSRNEAVALIDDKRVFLEGCEIQKPGRNVNEGDKLTVRGKGVFFITDTGSLSKKGKIILKYEKYV